MNTKLQIDEIKAHELNHPQLKLFTLTFFMVLVIVYSGPIYSQTIPEAPYNVTSNPTAVCPSSPYANLKAVSPGNTIKWYTVSVGGTAIGTTASGGGLNVYVDQPTSYYAESVTPAKVVSTSRTVVTVGVNTEPVITYMPADVNTNNTSGQCGTIVTYPSASAIGTPAPNIVYSDSSGSNFDGGNTTVIVSAVNVCATSSLSFDVTVNDLEVPEIIAPADISLIAPAGMTAIPSPFLGLATASDNCGIITIYNDAPAVFPAGSTTVTWTTVDYNNNVSHSTQVVNVTLNNIAPVFDSPTISTGGNVIAAGAPATLKQSWTDDGNDHTVAFDWNDGTEKTVLTGVTGSSATASHTYAASGVYEPTITVTDYAGASATTSFQYLSVYVTGNDFTTAGGYFMVTPGMLVKNPSSTGKANMGSNCKPKSTGIFQGEFEFNFKEGNFNFKSSKTANWDYLIISDCYLATFKGTGTVNGSGNYGILVSQSDKDRNPSNKNNIRIKIWNKDAGNAVVFDTQAGAADNALPTTPMANGTIKIHTDRTCSSKSSDLDMQGDGTLQASAFPNPFTGDLSLNFTSNKSEKVEVSIFDPLGKQVMTTQLVEPNIPFTLNNDLTPGIYYVRATQAEQSQVMKVVKN